MGWRPGPIWSGATPVISAEPRAGLHRHICAFIEPPNLQTANLSSEQQKRAQHSLVSGRTHQERQQTAASEMQKGNVSVKSQLEMQQKINI